MKILRYTLFGLLGLIFLLIAAVAVALVVIDPNSFKPHIEGAVSEHTNLELELRGDMGWSLFPLGLEVNEAYTTLDDEHFASVEQVLARVDLFSLIRMAPSVHTFVLDGFDAHLIMDEDGTGNWERILPEEDEAVAEEEDVVTEEDEEIAVGDEDDGMLVFNIQQVRIGDARVRYEDRQNDQDVTLENATLEMRDIALGQDFPLDLSFHVALADPDLTVDGQLSMLLNASEDLQQFRLSDLDSEFELGGELFDGNTVTATLAGGLSANLADETATVDDLEVGFENLRLTTRMDVQGFEQPSISGRFDLHEFSLRELLKRLGQEDIETDDGDVLKKVSAGADITTSNPSIRLEDLFLQLDDTRFEGHFGYGLEDGAIELDLQGNQFNLDRYLPPAREEEEDDDSDEETDTEDADWDAELLPLEALRELILDVRIGLDELIASGLTITELETKVSGRDGRIALEHLRGNLYEGDFNLSAELDARTDNPRWSFNQRLEGVRTALLLKDLADIDLLSGKVNLRADVQTRGNTLNALVDGSRGDARFDIEEGAFEGFNLTEMACRGIAMAHQEQLASPDWEDRTPFKDLFANITIDAGTLDNTELRAELAGLRLEGNGTVDVRSLDMAYRLGLRVVGSVTDDRACRVNERVQNIVIPVRCDGNLQDDPAGLCRFDTRRFTDVLTSMGRAELDRQRQQLEQEAREATDKLRQEAEGRAREERERLEEKAEEEGRRLLDRLRR